MPSDRFGGARIIVWVFVAMNLGAIGIHSEIGISTDPTAFPVFFASFPFVFAASGVGNASTFQMIPPIMRKEVARLEPELTGPDLIKQSDKEAAAIIGFSSAIAAFGAFFVPKSLGTSIAAAGGAEFALYGFLAFYVSCIGITWWFYTRRGGLLCSTSSMAGCDRNDDFGGDDAHDARPYGTHPVRGSHDRPDLYPGRIRGSRPGSGSIRVRLDHAGSHRLGRRLDCGSCHFSAALRSVLTQTACCELSIWLAARSEAQANRTDPRSRQRTRYSTTRSRSSACRRKRTFIRSFQPIYPRSRPSSREITGICAMFASDIRSTRPSRYSSG
jgi:hypothetical protein